MKRNGNNRAMVVSKTQIPEGWRLVRVGDVAEVVMGQSPPGELVNDWDGTDGQTSGLPFIQGNAEFGANFPNPVKWCTQPLKVGVSGDILISVRAPVGETNRADRKLGIGRGLAAVRFNKRYQAFGWHILNHAKEALERVTQGSTFQAIGGGELRNLPVLLPPLPEQRAIAAVLDTIDDAIERTAAVIAATEQLRDSLLHQLLTRGVPGWHTAWKEVPGLGTMPADWDVVSLGEVYEVQLGKMLSPKAKQGANPKPYLTNRNVRWGGFDLADLPTMDFDEREIKKFQLRQGDLMVCEGGDTGRAAVWEEPIVDCYYQKALHRLRPKGNTEIPKFMLAVLMFYGNNGILLEYSEQTSISHLTRERLLRMPVPNPPRTEQQGIADTLDCIEFVLIQSQEEQDRLESLKHSVADGLLTGNLRISLPSVSTQCGLSDV